MEPPRFFGLPDQDGPSTRDRRAELLLLDANPLVDLATLRRPRADILGGRVLDRTDLDTLETTLLERSQ